MTVPMLTMNNSRTIPQFGFGVFQIKPEETAEATSAALRIGYRHIDTAQMYRNEAGVGDAVRSSGMNRADVFITSKLNNGAHEPEKARAAFASTLEKLGTDYVDLFLIHWPLPTLYNGDYVSTWKTLIEFYRDGRARSIGVSNFQVAHLQRLAEETHVVPAVNQIEVHPYFANNEVRAYGRQHGILIEAWSPIAQGKVLDDPVLKTIAGALGKTTAQVTLRWHIQRGDVVFPKTTHEARMGENLAVFDFTLDEAQMHAIDGLDRGEPGRNGPNPEVFAYLPS
jgi:2,5-diketo-D-gluconate reductase A